MNDMFRQEPVAAPQGLPQSSQKETYLPPTIEVIEVKTEQGYALSGKAGAWQTGSW